MSIPQHPPKQHTLEPRAFGRASSIKWCPASPGSEGKLLAAKLQHAYATIIGTAIEDRFHSLNDYAREAGIDYQRFTKVLRGEIVMRLEDIAIARRHLGDIIPVPPGFEP